MSVARVRLRECDDSGQHIRRRLCEGWYECAWPSELKNLKRKYRSVAQVPFRPSFWPELT